MKRYTFGAAAKLGDGVNDQFHRFCPFDGRPVNVSSNQFRIIETIAVLPIACNKLVSFRLGDYLEDSVLRILELCIVDDDSPYYKVSLVSANKGRRCTTFEKYAEKTAHHVVEVDYGIHLEVVVEKTHFPVLQDEMSALMSNALKDVDVLSEAQKTAKCRVLINTVETREMALKDVFEFRDQFLEGQLLKYESLVVVEIAKNKTLDDVVVEQEPKLRSFLSYLYTCYRKIELKLQAAAYPRIVPVPAEGRTLLDTCAALSTAKQDFDQVDKTDFFDMYPVLKRLFHAYRDYLRRVVDNRMAVDEGVHLPAAALFFQLKLMKLNRWTPVKIGDNWYGCDHNLLIVPGTPAFGPVRERISALIKGVIVREDSQLLEPHLVKMNEHVDGLFGFVDMTGAVRGTDVEEAVQLKFECPENCSQDKRKWICSSCGDAVRIHQLYLSCRCGVQQYKKELLRCNRLTHPSRASTPAPPIKTEAVSASEAADETTLDDSSSNKSF